MLECRNFITIYIVKEKSNLRSIIEAGNNAIRLSYNQDISSRQIANKFQDEILKIDTDSKNGISKIGNVLEDVIDKIEENYRKGGGITGISTRFDNIDRYASGLQKGELIIIAGRPSMGKTAFAINLALNIADCNKSIGIFSLEMPKDQLLMRMLSCIALIPFMDIRRGSLNEKQWIKISDVLNTLNNKTIFIDDNSAITVNEIKAKAKRLKIKHGIDVIIIDYLGLIKGYGENRTQELSNISRGLKNLAKELEVSVIALSQLNRAPEQRNDHRPMLSDLRESGSIEQDTDVVLLLYRDEYYNAYTDDKNIIECIFAKNRNGKPGTIKLKWEPKYQKITSIL